MGSASMAQHGLCAIEVMILYIKRQHASNERYQVNTEEIHNPYTKLSLAYEYRGQVTVWRVSTIRIMKKPSLFWPTRRHLTFTKQLLLNSHPE